MFISGFTIVRNAEIMGYPVVASIRSILPIVDEFVVGVGQSDDATRALIEGIGDPRIRIVDTVWDPTRQRGGFILADKTNEILAQCRGEWCFYLQADEVVHEDDLAAVVRSCREHAGDPRVEGLLFRYLHFYGSYSVLATARNWYRQEVRIVRRSAGARSIKDAQSFVVGDRNLRVKWSGASVYHYGHVKPPARMGVKNEMMSRWYRGHERDGTFDNFQFRSTYGLRRFRGTHPAVMAELVAAQDWSFEPRVDPREWRRSDFKHLASDLVERVIRYRIGERKRFRILRR